MFILSNIKKVFVLYPPGKTYQRGEDRCQIDVDFSVSNSIRACNDLGYAASVLKGNYDVLLKDYPAEKSDYGDFVQDFNSFMPDVVLISVTNGSIFGDIDFVKNIKRLKNDTVIILKGALFFNLDKSLFDEIDLSNVDYLIGGEIEFIIGKLLLAHFGDKSQLKNIQGVSYKDNGEWISNELTDFDENLDSLPFPDRFLMKNSLYLNPMTDRPMATIATSKGCPSSCIYCLSPKISGRKVRFRSPKSVFDEISDCVEKHNICDFFFKSDTFTINKNWVIELCDLIINSPLRGKIFWVANSRVNTLDEELLKKMKLAGCEMIALGLESGSDESLRKMKKGTTVQQNRDVVAMIKKVGLQIFGFYLIGFPWEDKKHLAETRKLMFELDTDFIELSIVIPFKGSELYKMVFDSEETGKNVLGKDSFKNTMTDTNFLTQKELVDFRKQTILAYHLRFKYIVRKLFSKNLTLHLLKNYAIYGFRILKNTFLNFKEK